jgi:hypothetical protein
MSRDERCFQMEVGIEAKQTYPWAAKEQRRAWREWMTRGLDIRIKSVIARGAAMTWRFE